MKAIMVREHGGPEVLKLEDAPKPAPKAGEAVVKVHAAGLNFIDIYRRRGTYPMPIPSTPGVEGAGVVESVGDGVTDVKAGDRVCYTDAPGSYAEYVIVKADRLIPLPDSLSFEQGAAIPLQGMTAHYLIHEFRLPKRGDVVLIHAAAGGMGLLLTQWAHHLGARVIGTTSSEEKAKLAKEAGADEVIIYTRDNFVDEIKRMTDGKGVELIIDGVGKTTFAGNLEAAKVRGNIVIFGAASGPADPIAPNALQQKSLTISGGALWNYISSKEELMKRSHDVIQGVKDGWLKLNIGEIYPLEKAEDAHRSLEGRKSTGKLVLKIS